jgi:hypothetical protein
MSGYDMLMSISSIDEELIEEADDVKKKKRLAVWKIMPSVAAAVIALCVIFAVPLMAVAGSEQVYEMLYRISPSLAQKIKPVNVSCEDKGILMTVAGANFDGDTAEIVVSLRDLEGDRIDETTDLFDSYSIHTPYDQSGGCSVLGYDEETGEISFLITVHHMGGEMMPGDKVTFSVSSLLANKSDFDMILTQIDTSSLPEITEVIEGVWLRGSGGSTVYDDMRFMAPNMDPAVITPGVTLMGYGLLDGKLHVQIKYDDIRHTDNHGFLFLEKEGEERIPYEGSYSWFDGPDSIEEYVFAYPDGELSDYSVSGQFRTADKAIEGYWSVTVPLSGK